MYCRLLNYVCKYIQRLGRTAISIRRLHPPLLTKGMFSRASNLWYPAGNASFPPRSSEVSRQTPGARAPDHAKVFG